MRVLKNAMKAGLVFTVALGFWAGAASAANTDLDEVAALLALPVVTASYGDSGGTVTAIVVTNAGPETRLHINLIDGDTWKAKDLSCVVTANETTLFIIEADPFDVDGALLTYECFKPDGGGEEFFDRVPISDFRNGIMVVTLEDPTKGQGDGSTINANYIFGDATIVDFSHGTAWSVGAIPFQGKDATGDDVSDRQYRFDNLEYAAWPSATASNFIAATPYIDLEAILFTLDGTVGANQPVPAMVSIKIYDDDEMQSSSSFAFDCFAIVDLADVDGRFTQSGLGSEAGHMVLTPQTVTYPNVAHDGQFDGGGILGSRTVPVHGWIFQTISTGGGIGDVGDIVNDAAWGRTYAQSTMPIVTGSGDTPVLNAP